MGTRERLYFDSFREAVKAVTSTLDISEVLTVLVRKVAEVMDAKGCAIRLLDPSRRTLELVAHYGLSEGYIRKGPVNADRSLAEAMEGNTVCVYNAREDSRAQYPREAAEEDIYGIISVPLPVKGRIIGVLRLYTGEPRTISEDDLGFLEALGEMGALAIENARLYDRAKKDYETVMSDVYTFVGYRQSL
jgi:signal transduction protein with GAF and PtsI domain